MLTVSKNTQQSATTLTNLFELNNTNPAADKAMMAKKGRRW